MYFGILAFYQVIVYTVKNCAVHCILAKLTCLLNETAVKWNRTRNLLNVSYGFRIGS